MRRGLRACRRGLLWALVAALIVAVAMGCYLYLYTPLGRAAEAELFLEAANEEQARLIAADCARWAGDGELLAEAGLPASTRAEARRVNGSRLLLLRVSSETGSVSACNALALALVRKADSLSLGLRLSREAATEGLNLRALLARTGLTFVLCFVLLSLILTPSRLRRPTLSERDDTESLTGLPTLARLPDCKRMLDAFFRDREGGLEPLRQYASASTIEEIRALALFLQRRSRERSSIRSVVLAAHAADESKSAVCALLAEELCAEGRRVLCVDMDCDSPTLGALLRVRGACDLVDYLRGEAPLDQAVLKTPVEGLFLIDQCHRASMAATLVSSDAFRSFLTRATEEFDFVLFDTPPMRLCMDAAAFSGVTDATVLAFANGRCTYATLRDTLRRLRLAGRSPLGFVTTHNPANRERLYRDDDDR